LILKLFVFMWFFSFTTDKMVPSLDGVRKEQLWV